MLFKITKTIEQDITTSPGIKEETAFKKYLTQQGQTLRNHVAQFERDYSYHLVSHGTWSSHHLLRQILEQYGPATLIMTTWSMSEPAVKEVLRMVDEKLITDITALFDIRTPTSAPEAVQLAQANIAKCSLGRVHAKMLVLHGDGYSVSITTSANLTTNRKVERYVVTFNDEIADFDRDWILAMVADANPFLP